MVNDNQVPDPLVDYVNWYESFIDKHGRQPSELEKLKYATGEDMWKGLADSLRFTRPSFKRLYDR